MDGHGIVQWKDGRHYVGQWSNGQRMGYGRYVWNDGKSYEGQYTNDKKHGYGEYKLQDGRTYKGGYRDDKQHGLATYVMMNQKGSMRKKNLYGLWDAGRRVKWFDIDKDGNEEE